jgi:glycerophosphoryl diester phosphodiesterase
MVWWLDSPITHRGLHDNEKGIPENSMSAFSQSIAAKLPIELDVHLLKDGNIAVFHDDSLKRMTGIDSPIRDQTLSDIRRLRLFNTKESVPTLQEVLELVNGEVPLLIEIKNRDSVGTLERRLLEILKQYHGDYALESFNPFSMLWFKKESPDIDRGQLSGDFKDEDLAFHKKLLLRRLAFNRLVSPSFVA